MLREIAGYLRLKKEVKSSEVICEKAGFSLKEMRSKLIEEMILVLSMAIKI